MASVWLWKKKPKTSRDLAARVGLALDNEHIRAVGATEHFVPGHVQALRAAVLRRAAAAYSRAFTRVAGEQSCGALTIDAQFVNHDCYRQAREQLRPAPRRELAACKTLACKPERRQAV